MDLADMIIASNTGRKKKKKNGNETLADQIIDGSYIDTVTVERNVDDLAPIKSVVKEQKEEEEDRTWFSKGAFSDGYQAGDITKTILGTTLDIGTGATKGIFRIGEGLGDLVSYGVAGVADLFGNDDYADELRKEATINKTDEIFFPTEQLVDPLSVIGEKGDSVSEGIGYIGAILATGGVGSAAGLGTAGTTALTTGLTGFSSMGSGMSEAYQGGATDEEALKYGIIAGVAEAGSELIFGGLGKAVNAVGLSKGLSSLDDALAKKISSKISSTVGKNLAEYTIKSSAEGVEEIISGIAQGIGKKMTYMSDEDLVQILKDENLLEQFIVGTVTSSIAQAPGLVKTTSEGKPFISDNTQDNQVQIEGLQQEIAKKTEELNKSQDVREKQIIQETINGLNEELNELTNAQKITDEKELRKQNFTYEAQENDSDIKKAIYESASQVMNNTEKAHKFVDVVAKIADEKGTVYKFTNNEQLKQLGYTKEGMTVNGLVNENGEVLINIDSAKELNTVVGHETTHLLEGTKEYEALKQMAIEYSKTKGDYDARIEKLTKLYEGTNADIEAELTSDIVGEYLFTDENFVKELSVKQPTVFEKIRNFISDLVVKFKGTDQEKQLRQLQRTFEKAYKAQGTQTSTDIKYSLSEGIVKDGFYSQLENVIVSKMQNSADAKSVLNLIRNNGVKQDEIAWTEIEDYLNEKGNEKVTKQEVLDYIRENQLKIEEVLKGDSKVRELTEPIKQDIKEKKKEIKKYLDKYDIDYEEDDVIPYKRNGTRSETIGDLMADSLEKLVDLEQYPFETVNGVKIYTKEISFSDGVRAEIYFTEEELKNDMQDLEYLYDELTEAQMNLDMIEDEYGDDADEIGLPKYKNYKTNFDGGENYREILYRVPNEQAENKNLNTYHSPHWNENNILAHTRLQDYTDNENKKVLFIEEIQSDMHQEGRKSGYVSQENKQKLEDLNKKIDKANQKTKELKEQLDSIRKVVSDKWEAVYQAEYDNNKSKIDQIEKNLTKLNEQMNYQQILAQVKALESRGYAYTDFLANVELTAELKDAIRLRMRNNKLFTQMMNMSIADDVSTELAYNTEYQEILNKHTKAYSELHNLRGEKYNIKDGVDSAYPYKKNWQEFTLRKIINEAVKNGYDKVAWTTGNQQDARYNLAEYVDKIEYHKGSGGDTTTYIDTFKNGGLAFSRNIPNSELSNYLGKDIAMQIINSKDQHGTITQEDMRVSKQGNSGMSGFYDKIIPEYLSKYLKKWNSKVEDVYIGSNKQQGFTITPEMKNAIATQGQPLYSLSAENEIAPIGQRGTYGKDVRLEIEEAIAPLQETISNLSEQLEAVLNSTEQVQEVAPIQEIQPTQPTLEEVQNLIDIRDNKSGSEYARAFFALRDKYGQVELYKSLNEYYSTGTVTQPSNVGDIDTAPVSQDIVEEQGQEAFNTLTDEQAPSWEDAIFETPEEILFETGENTGIKVESPLDSRDIDEVGNRKIKAYQYENPEVKPFFQAEAQNMLYDLDNTIKGERIATQDEEGYITGWAGITRQTTEAIAYLKDNYGYSYDQIRQGLNKIIEDDGKENNAVSKRIEFMLDERLREGYTTSDGIPIPANEDYISFLNEKQVTEYNKEAFNAITDEDIPMYEKIEPLESPTTRENTVRQQTASMKIKTAQNGNTGLTKTVLKPELVEGKKRRWVGTSTESEVVNREVLPDDLDYNAVYYQPITNKETLNTANARLDGLGYEDSIKYFKNKILDKRTTVEDIALGERLIQEAIKKGDTKTAGDIIQDVAILGTELGQKVQALSIIQRMTPEGQLKMLEKTINRGKTKGDQAFTDVNLTQEMKDKILNTYKEDGSYNQDELNKAVDEVKQQIADQMQVTAMDKVNAWRYLSMLGNPKTHIRNLVSNVAMKGTVAVKNALARTVETIAPIENRTKTWKAASDEVAAFAKQTTLEMKDIISGDSKYSESADIKAKREIFKTKVLEKAANFNSDLLEKEDWWFSKGAFESSFREFLTANGIETQQDIQNNPELIEKGKNYAVEQAQIATFRQYSWLSNKIRDIESKNAATQIAVGAVLPFKKTPINIAKTGLSYSPLGFAKTLTYDIAQVKKGNMEASTLIDHLAQNTTGTALTLVGYMLAQAGFLNGAGDDDKEGKYDYQLGKQSYSINIGGSTYSLSWLSPVAMPLFVGANAYEQLVEGEEWNADVVLETLGQTLDPLSEMSFLSSLDSVLSSYDSGVQRFFGIGEAMVQNYVTQFVPTASSQLAATLDDTKRSTKVSGDSTMKVLEETYNKLIYKIPGLRETLEPTTDIWGNEIKQNENLFTRAFENFIAPYARKDSIATEIDEELKDLYGQTGDTGLLPSIPYNYVKYDGERYDMSAEEYTDYKKMYGQTANDLLEDLFRTTTYKNATSEERADMVNDVYDYARDEAKLDYLAKEGVDYTNATEDKVEVYKENLIKGAVENDMTTKEYGLYLEDPEEYKFLMEKDYEYRRQYFDTYDSLKELDKSFDEQKEGINDDDELDVIYSEKKAGIVDKIINSGLDDTEKASLYKRYYNSDTVDTIMKSAINIDDYLVYETKEFKADKNEKGNSIPGSRKDKVIDYVNTLDMSIGQKAILIKSTNTFKFNDYNEEIVRYVDSLGLSYDEMVSILEDLDMTVKDDMVYWD